jgi:hypothetical protein
VKWVYLSSVERLMVPAYAIRIHDAFADRPLTRSHDGERLLP